MMNIPPLKFTEADSERAYAEWGANCGPHALAAATGRTLDDARRVLVGFDLKRYTNPSMMENGLNLLGLFWGRQRGLHIRDYSEMKSRKLSTLCRVQWEGRWLDPGVPAAAAYRHTHWVAYFQGHIFCTVVPVFGWVTYQDWAEYLDRWTKANSYRGWHITHVYELEA